LVLLEVHPSLILTVETHLDPPTPFYQTVKLVFLPDLPVTIQLLIFAPQM